MKYKNTYTKLERFLKTISSRKRIEILELLYKKENLNLNEIAKKINTEKQNASLHTFKLLNQGLITKRQNKNKVEHIITKRGVFVLKFIKDIDKRI